MCSTLKNSNNNKVAIVLTQGFADWEYALIAGVGKSFYGLDVEFFSPDTGEIVSQGGLVTTVSQNIDQISTWSPKVVAVIGGTLWASENAPDISKLLKMQHLDGGIVAGICGGTLALARAKLLDETMHTSNDIDFLNKNAKAYRGADYFRESASAIFDKDVITAPGTAPVSFAAKIFEAAGINQDTVIQFKKMMSAEHDSY